MFRPKRSDHDPVWEPSTSATNSPQAMGIAESTVVGPEPISTLYESLSLSISLFENQVSPKAQI